MAGSDSLLHSCLEYLVMLMQADSEESFLHTVGMLLAALGLFVLRRTAEPPLPRSTGASAGELAV